MFSSSINAMGLCKLVISNFWCRRTTDYCSFADRNVPILSCISRLYHRKKCFVCRKIVHWEIPWSHIENSAGNISNVPQHIFHSVLSKLCRSLSVSYRYASVSSVKLLSTRAFFFLRFCVCFLHLVIFISDVCSYSLLLTFELPCYNICPSVRPSLISFETYGINVKALEPSLLWAC
jgi:hypothetical protein